MKKFVTSILMTVMVLCGFFLVEKGTPVQAAIADEAESYEMGEYLDGKIEGIMSNYAYRYYKLIVNAKSHVSIDLEVSRTSDIQIDILSSAGTYVFKNLDFKYKENAVTGMSKSSLSRVLQKGTYYLAIGNGSFYDDLDYKFRVQAEKHISLPKGTVSSLKSPKKGQITVACKAAPNAIGYKFTIATNEKFTQGKKEFYSYTPTKVITGLKRGTRYFVKVCSYTVYDDGTRVFGQNSLPKSIIVKRT